MFLFSRPQTPESSTEGRRLPTTESTDIAVEELSRSAQFIERRPSPVHTLSEAIESFFAEEKKPNPTLASHKSFFSAYKGTGFITNPEGTGFTTNPFTSNNPLGKGTSSIPGPNPQLSNTLPVTEPAYTLSAPKELGLCKNLHPRVQGLPFGQQGHIHDWWGEDRLHLILYEWQRSKEVEGHLLALYHRWNHRRYQLPDICCYDFYSFTHSFSLNYTLDLIL